MREGDEEGGREESYRVTSWGVGIVGIPYLQAGSSMARDSYSTFDFLGLPPETEDEGMILPGLSCLIIYPHGTSYYKGLFIPEISKLHKGGEEIPMDLEDDCRRF